MNKRLVERSIQWAQSRAYEVEELRRAFVEAVAHDDDCLAQYVERGELMERPKKSSTFHQLVEVWEWLSEEQGEQTSKP